MLNETPAPLKTDGAYGSMFPEQGVAHDAEEPVTNWDGVVVTEKTGRGCFLSFLGGLFVLALLAQCHTTGPFDGASDSNLPYSESGVMDAPSSEVNP